MILVKEQWNNDALRNKQIRLKNVEALPSQVSQGLRSSETRVKYNHGLYPMNCPYRLAVLQSSTNLLLHSDTNVKRLLELCLSEGLQTALQSPSIHVCSSLCEWESSGVPRRGSNCRLTAKVEVQQFFPVHTFQPISLVLVWEHIQSRDGFLWSVNINLPRHCGWDYIKRVLTNCTNATVVTLALMGFTGFLNVQIKMFY